MDFKELLIPLCFLFIVLGLRDLYVYYLIRKKKIKTKGEVIDMIVFVRGFTPLIEYYYNGQKYSSKPVRFLFDSKYEIGEKVNIFLNPNKPDQFVIDNKRPLFFSMIICIVHIIIFVSIYLFK